ncbi:MAG: hypothetical protein ACRD20_18925 [Terriglobales bacterium]
MSATVVTGISTLIAESASAAAVRRVSAAVVRHVSTTVTARGRSATAGVAAAIAVVPGTTHRSAPGPARLSARRTPLAM